MKERSFQKAVRKLKALQPSLLMYSAFSAQVPKYIEFDKYAKKHLQVKSIMGGPGPTYDWSLSRRSTIDAFCIGEGEYALPEFIMSGYSDAKNIMLNGDDSPTGYFPLAILDELPLPDRSVVYEQDRIVRDITTKWFLSGRGCPYKCTYCFNHKFNDIFKSCGPLIRKKSVDYLLEEIQEVKKHYPMKSIAFQDDTFIVNKEWFFEFCGRYPCEVGLPYTCNIRPNLVSREIVAALKESRCVTASWSIESGNNFIRNTLLKRNVSKEQIIETGRLLHEFSINFRGGSMIGLPGETHEQRLETLKLNIDIKPTLANATIYVPYPNLDLTNYALKNNYLSEEALSNLPRTLYTSSILNFSAEEKKSIRKLAFLFPIIVRFPFLFKRRRIYKLLFALPNRMLLIMHECFYAFMHLKVSNTKLPISVTLRMIVRYLFNRQMS